jgi:hypothetical protein
MHTLDDKIDISGEWWLIEKPESVVPGQLTFSRQDGIDLHLHQAFTPPVGSIRPGDPNPQYSVVHGVTVEGAAVTLIDARQIGTSFNYGTGGLRQPGRIYARILVIGAHLPPDIKFTKVHFRVPRLQVWLGQIVIQHRIVFDGGSKFSSQSFDFGKMPEDKFRLASIGALASCYYGWNSTSNPYSSIKVDVTAGFSFQPDEPKVIDWFLEQQETMLTMVSLLSGDAMVTDAIEARIDNSKNGFEILASIRSAKAPQRNRPDDFFLSRLNISVPFKEYCNKWFELWPKIHSPALLARSVMASEDVWLHMEFLSLIQALEGLHRSLYGGQYMDDDQYKEVKHALNNAIPQTVAPDHKDALKSKIKYGNQISLRKRLDELSDNLSLINRFFIFGERKATPQQWISTRNYYTHWDQNLLPDTLDDQSLHYANIRVRNFIRALYAQLIGVPSSDVEAAFRGTSRVAQELLQINILEKRATDPSYVPQPLMTISITKPGDKEKSQSVEGQVDTGQKIPKDEKSHPLGGDKDDDS